jgi:pSer/pThr/pTyr-binding forkhead associated (FHA) protein
MVAAAMIRPSRTISPRATGPRPALVPAGRFDTQPPFYLDRPVTLIGSRHRAHIRLESEDVSRSHAVVVYTRGRVIVRDLGSRTRVYVNGREAWEATLAHGDYLTIGHFSFRFDAGDVGRYLGGAQGAPAAVLTGPVLPAGAAPLDRDLCVIGCRQGADLLLRGSAVSFAHAIIVRHEAGHLIRDLGSRTGTFLNGVPIEGDAELRDGMVIRVGPYELRYDEAEQAPRAAARGAPPVLRDEPARSVPAAEDEGLLSEIMESLPVLPPAEFADVPAAPSEEAYAAPVDELRPMEEEPAPQPPVEQQQAPQPPVEPAPEPEPAIDVAQVPVTEAPPAVSRPAAQVPVAKPRKPRAPRKKPAAKAKAAPRREPEDAPAADFPALVATAPVMPLEAATVVLPPAPPEPAALTNVTVFLPALEPLAEPAAAVDAPAERVATPAVHHDVPVPAEADVRPEAPDVTPEAPDTGPEGPPAAEPLPPAAVSEDVAVLPEALIEFAPESEFEEPTLPEVAPPVVPESELIAKALEAFDFAPPAPAATDDLADVAHGSSDFEPGPAAAVAAAGVAADAVPSSVTPAVPADPAPRPLARAGARHEPAKPPPAHWGVLATAIAMSELPPDEAAPAAPPDLEPAGNPGRRSSRLKWFTAAAVLLVGGAATVVAVFGHSALLKFLR